MRRPKSPAALRSRSCRAVERLEARMMLHANPLLWAGDGNLTLSFAPDGTRIAGFESSLEQTFNAVAPEAQWKEAILRAFQTWAVETNAAIGVVGDDKSDFGVAGISRNDPRFGDIRIGAAPLESGVFAIAISASDALSGTWVGDVIFNSDADFADLDAIFATALHEAGHVFGIDHSEDPLSPMHMHGITPATSLTTADIAAIQSLYGLPQPDANERGNSNDTMTSATQLKLNSIANGGPGSAPSLVYGAITAPGDADYFRLTAPDAYSGTIKISLRSAGISLLASSLSVLNGNGEVLASKTSLGANGSDLTLTVDSSSAEGVIIQVTGARDDVFGVGSYSLSATFDAVNQVSSDTLDNVASGGFRFLPQQELSKLLTGKSKDQRNVSTPFNFSPGFPADTRYEVVGSISEAGEVDSYKVKAPADLGSVMTIRVRSLEHAGLIPAIKLLGRDGEELPFKVLVNGGGEYVMQVYGIEPHEMITLSVSAVEGASSSTSGNYRIFVAFNEEAVEYEPVATGVLAPGQPIQESSLYVALPQLFHFALAVPATAPAGAAVMVTIRDADNNVVYRVASRAGDTRTAGSVLLKPGAYTVQVVGYALDPLDAELAYTLFAKVSSDPFGANPDDPTFQPEFQCDDPEHAGLYCYPGEFVSPDPYLWGDFTATVSDPRAGESFHEFVESVLGEWWTWIWGQMGVNGPPLAQGDLFSVAPAGAASSRLLLSGPLNILSNDLEPEQETLVAILQSTTSHGQLTLRSDGTFTYIPDLGFQGVDSFTYVASDLVSESRETTVRIQVGFRGDYDANEIVDGSDFLNWQRTLSETVATAGSGADGDADGAVTVADAYVWNNNFGTLAPPVPATHRLPSQPSEPALVSSTEELTTLPLDDVSLVALNGVSLAPQSDTEVSLRYSSLDRRKLLSAGEEAVVRTVLPTDVLIDATAQAGVKASLPSKRLMDQAAQESRLKSVDQALEELSKSLAPAIA